MPNTYSQLNAQCVFAVKGRENIITSSFRDRLHSYISGILKNSGAYPLSVGGWKDHVHVFFEFATDQRISDLMRDLKASSSKWINDNRLVAGQFRWQTGYGAFTYSRPQRDQVIRYITNQEQHHKTKTFREEYIEMLQNFDMPFENEYLFEFYE